MTDDAEGIIQVDLLSLIHSITGEKDELQQTKLSKVKVSLPIPSTTIMWTNHDHA